MVSRFVVAVLFLVEWRERSFIFQPAYDLAESVPPAARLAEGSSLF
jgi:hypothetical protein